MRRLEQTISPFKQFFKSLRAHSSLIFIFPCQTELHILSDIALACYFGLHEETKTILLYFMKVESKKKQRREEERDNKQGRRAFEVSESG